MIVTLPGPAFYERRPGLLAELDAQIEALKAEIKARFARKVEKCIL
jgi:hypothetical protein